MTTTKPFDIPKQWVWQAWTHIKANGGSHGVDQMSIQAFEADLGNQLYKLWNRLSSGSYFPPPVRRVEIPKANGKTRPLGIPTVSDRIAQMVVKQILEPQLDPIFHPDSYGYRPGKSAIDAVRQTRQRCWQYRWVVDLDIQGFFDSIDHTLMMKAVEKHTQDPWVRLYIRRWLTAPVQHADGTSEARTQGTPQGGVISPLLANLFLHYAMGHWVMRHYPAIRFERYADDAVFHCHSREQAEQLLSALTQRLKACHLTVHPDKTKIVNCKSRPRKRHGESVSFDFLGFTFQPRKAKTKYGNLFTGFTPAISQAALKRITAEIRQWQLHQKSNYPLEALAAALNPKIRGWLNYYRHFGRGKLYRITYTLDKALVRWARKKYKRFKPALTHQK
jgi:RNA-directed DNA polymerase